jgi:hypothetical protein
VISLKPETKLKGEQEKSGRRTKGSFSNVAGPLLFLHTILSSPHPSLLPHLLAPPLPLNPIDRQLLLASYSRCPPTITRIPKAPTTNKAHRYHTRMRREIDQLPFSRPSNCKCSSSSFPVQRLHLLRFLVWRAAGSFPGGFDLRRCPLAARFACRW